MKNSQRLFVGAMVIFHDEGSYPHNALVKCIHGSVDEDYMPCINLVFVSQDDSRKDQYGRQTEVRTSVVHKSDSHCSGFYYRFLDEEPNKIEPVIS
jgi:hypothetical protein